MSGYLYFFTLRGLRGYGSATPCCGARAGSSVGSRRLAFLNLMSAPYTYFTFPFQLYYPSRKDRWATLDVFERSSTGTNQR